MLIFPKPICRGVQLLVCGAGLQAPVLLLPHHHIHSRYSKVQFSYYLSLYTSQVQYSTHSTVKFSTERTVQKTVQFSYYLITIYIPGTVKYSSPITSHYIHPRYSTVHTVQ